VEASPGFVLNEGRQVLFGNVGYRVLEANMRELIREPAAGAASWGWVGICYQAPRLPADK